MIEPVDVSALAILIDDHRIREKLPGMSVDQRLRTLADEGVVWLRDSDGDGLAIFRPLWLGSYDAVVLDIDNITDFTWQSLQYFFANTSATTITLASDGSEAGAALNAFSHGLALMPNSPTPWKWTLTRADFIAALSAREAAAPAGGILGVTDLGADPDPPRPARKRKAAAT